MVAGENEHKKMVTSPSTPLGGDNNLLANFNKNSPLIIYKNVYTL